MVLRYYAVILFPVTLLIYNLANYKKEEIQSIVFKDLDPILHSQLRLAVMSLLISVKQAEFTFLKEKTNATAGNLSVQIQKLKDAGYIDVIKQFKDNYPQTICKITPAGVRAFEEYVKNLQTYLTK
jgi:DNA-binding MarR family transcriptional regulator